jgi:hypothetical protein
MRRSMIIKCSARLLAAAGIALAAVVVLIGFGSTDAQAAPGSPNSQSSFTCTSDQSGVNIDLRGLGNSNICIEGSETVDINCACVSGGNNCPSDTKKQTFTTTVSSSESVAPQNGRVTDTFTIASPDLSCPSSFTCPSGQTPKVISFSSTGASFEACPTDTPAGQPCDCEGETALAQATCGAAGPTVVNAGKHSSCANLF